MNRIFRKLHSRDGASMLLAMVFLLFCTFVGSTVLVSATANAYRVNHLSDQQDFLTERSAALLLTDELQLEDAVNGKAAEYLQLVVTDIDKKSQPVDVHESGAVDNKGSASAAREITFQVVTNIPLDEVSAMQKLQLQAAVLRYLDEHPAAASSLIPGTAESPAPVAPITVKFKHFPDLAETDNFEPWDKVAGSLWLQKDPKDPDGNISGTVHFGNISNIDNTVNVPAFDVFFSCGDGDNLYDFWMDFGANSLLKVNMNAYHGATDPVEVNYPASIAEGHTASNPKYEKITTLSTQTVISWADPLIEKGAVTVEEDPTDPTE